MYLLNLSGATFRDLDNKSDILNTIDNLFEEGIVNVGGHIYHVEICIYDNIKYIKSVIPYEEHQFEKMFGFGCKCSNFQKGKIIVVV